MTNTVNTPKPNDCPTIRRKIGKTDVYKRQLHPLAPLMRLSPMYLPSADGFKNRLPPASLITKMKN